MTVDEVLKDSVNYVKIDPLANQPSFQVKLGVAWFTLSGETAHFTI